MLGRVMAQAGDNQTRAAIQACFSSALTRAGEIAASFPRPEVRMPGFSRGSAPIQYNMLAKMQRPVAANQTMAAPTKPVNRPHHGLCARNNMDPRVILTPTVT